MISRFKLLGILGLYWLIYFILIRLVFMTYNHDLTAELTVSEIGRVFLNGFRMDLSLMGYYLVLYGLLFVFSILHPTSKFRSLLKGYTIFLLVLSAIITVVDMELYRHWGFRLNNTPLFYAGPGAWGSITLIVWIKGLIVLGLLVGTGWLAYRKWVEPHTIAVVSQVPKLNSAAMLGITSLLILPIRGSLTVAPMNVGFVFFHGSKPYANHAAINVIWNFLSSLTKSAATRYPEDFVEPDIASQKFESLYPQTQDSPKITTVEKPNLLLIILEGFTADIIKPLGGLDSITPNLNQLAEQGILFTRFYASGDRTDKGLVTILSGYPAQPKTSIAKAPAKTANLPSLAGSLKNRGYHTSFLYGGDINFANLRSYITHMGFDQITDINSFPSELNTSKWGVHDQFVFDRAKLELTSTPTPFFKVILTLSSHEPFDVPMEPYITGKSEEDLYLNSCYYTDYWLGDFLSHARRQSWWDSTLVIITADHGHRHPNNKKLEDEKRFRIPLLLTGGALSDKPQRIDKLGGQTDIANTILGQIDQAEKQFKFSKDLLNPSSIPFAAYFFQNGYGFLLPEKHLVYDNDGNSVILNEGCNTEDIDLSKAYQQILYSDYNNR